ncbi:MAG TPA: SprT family zinc-dependent metalloprotease [Prosthecobacter sp.]|nr:SprT family zinc-dependent metalloprotease [Prosthecobacter sp.]
MTQELQLGEVAVDVVQKDIKNLHLSVHPPTGRVTISAPTRMKLDAIRVFAITKLGWIKQQQAKQRAQMRETPRDYVERESHYLWGRRYLMSVLEEEGPTCVEVSGNRIKLHVRPGTLPAKRHAIMDQWYRSELKQALVPLLTKWEKIIGVKAAKVFVQRMKTKWGSCNHRSGTVRFNTDLAKKPPECLEYLVVHELVHLLEHTHNARFVSLMDHYLSKWRTHQQALNNLPVRHEAWSC